MKLVAKCSQTFCPKWRHLVVRTSCGQASGWRWSGAKPQIFSLTYRLACRFLLAEFLNRTFWPQVYQRHFKFTSICTKIVQKFGNVLDFQNFVCKILESIIRDHIITHMTENNLFSPRQFGFISGRSTTLQLLHVLNIWTEILDQGGSLDIIYCDFMKAFDKVPHKRLLLKTEKYGITGNILGWIQSFLSNRTQCIKIKNSISKSAPVTSGIPQGSVLGPILFVLYINDLPEVVDSKSMIFLFADDTKIFRRIDSQADNTQLQKDIDSLIEWSNKWLLKFHPDKCVSMSMGGNNKHHEYHMGDHTLAVSECEKDIGVYIDYQLKFDTHINTMINKANRILAITRKTFDYIDRDSFNQIFKGLVRPHLEYATPVWSPHLERQKEAIENVQRRATKLIPGLTHMTYPDRLQSLELPTLAYRRARGDMIQVFKLMSDKDCYDKSLPNLLTASTTGLRGHDYKVFMDRPSKDIRKYNFNIRITKNWNSLPSHIVKASNLLNFEKKLDLYWKNQDLMFLDFKSEIKKNLYPDRLVVLDESDVSDSIFP